MIKQEPTGARQSAPIPSSIFSYELDSIGAPNRNNNSKTKVISNSASKGKAKLNCNYFKLAWFRCWLIASF